MKNNANGEFGAAEATPSKRRKSGRVIHEDGRGVWEWQTSTGVFTRDVGEEHLRRLERADLRIVEHTPVTVEDPMHKILDRLATGRNVKAKPTVVVDKQPTGKIRGFLRKWVG